MLGSDNCVCMHTEFGISTLQVPHVHDSTPIFNRKAVGQHLGHCVPVAGGEARLKALIHSACRVFQQRCRLAELIELRERGVEVCLLEDFAAIDHVLVDRQEVDPAPFGVEALARNAMSRMGADRPELAEPMYNLDVSSDVLVEVEARAEVFDQITGSESCPSAVVDAHAVWAGRR